VLTKRAFSRLLKFVLAWDCIGLGWRV